MTHAPKPDPQTTSDVPPTEAEIEQFIEQLEDGVGGDDGTGGDDDSDGETPVDQLMGD
jgi:hypothetical protein